MDLLDVLDNGCVFCELSSVVIKAVSMRLAGSPHAIPGKIELECDPSASELPPQRLRGRIVELGDLPVLADFRLRRGKHTLVFADDGRLWRFELLQDGATWFEATHMRQAPSLSPASVLAGVAFSLIIFVVINWFHFRRPVACWDCHFPSGLPFTFYQDGGFGGDNGLVWSGAIGNLAVVLAGGLAFAWAIGWLRRIR